MVTLFPNQIPGQVPSNIPSNVPSAPGGNIPSNIPSNVPNTSGSNISISPPLSSPFGVDSATISNKIKQDKLKQEEKEKETEQEELTEEMLRNDPEFLQDTKTILEYETGRPYTKDNKQLAYDGLERLSRVGWNFTNAGLTAFDVGSWTPEVQEAWARNLEKYKKTDPTLRSVGDALYFSVADAINIPLLFGPALLKLVGGPAAAFVARRSLQNAVQKELVKEATKKLGIKSVEKLSQKQINVLAKNAAKIVGPKTLTAARKKVFRKGGIPFRKSYANAGQNFKNALTIYAPMGATYAGAFDLFHQQIEAGEPLDFEDIDLTRFGLTAVTGGILGGTFAYLFPMLGEKFTRSRAIRKLQEADNAVKLNDSPEYYGLGEQARRLANEAYDDTLANDSTAMRVTEDIIKEYNKKGIKPDVHSFGSGIFKKANEKEAETFNKKKGDIIIPEIEQLKKGTAIEGGDKVINTVTSEELTNNVARAQKYNKKELYESPDNLGKENKDIMIMSNVAGRYDNPTLWDSVLEKSIKNLKDDGTLVVNIGPRRTKDLGDFESNQLLSMYDAREGKLRLQGDFKPREIVEELLPPDSKEGLEVLDGIKKVKLKEKVGIDFETQLNLLLDKFKDVKVVNKLGKPVFVAKNKIKFKPKINNTIPNSQKNKVRAGFDRILKLAPNWIKSSVNLPKDIVNRYQKSKSAQRAIGVNIQTQWNKLNQQLQSWTNKEGKRWKDWAPEERDQGVKRLDTFLFQKRGKDVEEVTGPGEEYEDVISLIPLNIRNQLLNMRDNIIEFQKLLLPKTKDNPDGTGYVKPGNETHSQMIAQTKNDKHGVTLYVNQQYQLFDNPDYIEKILNPQTDYYKNIVQSARKFFRTQFLKDPDLARSFRSVSKDIGNYTDDELGKLQKEYQFLDTKRNRTPEKLTNIEKERLFFLDKNITDEIFNNFLKRYSIKEIDDIRRLGLQGFNLNSPEGSAPIKGIFFRKQEIPPVLRTLMGEHRDPFSNYANTIMKLFQTYENFKYEDAIRKLAKSGQFPDLLMPRAGKVPLKEGTKSLLEASKLQKFSSDFDNPLEGIRADEVIVDAIRNGNELQPLINPTVFGIAVPLRQILGLQALTRISKTAYSVSALPRNFAGAMLKALGAGNLTITNLKVLPKVFAALSKQQTPELSAEVQKLQYLNIYGSGVKIANLKEALAETADINWFLDANRMMGTDKINTQTKLLGYYNKINNKILDVYQSMDDIWKWYSYLNERSNYRQVLKDKGINPDEVIDKFNSGGKYSSGPNKGKDIIIEVTALDDYAAQMTRAHMDNYGEVARIFKAARRFPTADFLAYKTEQLRTTYNIIETAFRDIREGRAQQKLGQRNEDGTVKGSAQLFQGYKRLGSIISALSLSTGTGYVTGNMIIGQDSEGEPTTLNSNAKTTIGGKEYSLNKTIMQAIRDAFLPEFARGQEYVPWLSSLGSVAKRNKDGILEFRNWLKEGLPMLNLSYIDPWAPWREILLSVLRLQGDLTVDNKWSQAKTRIADSIFDNFGLSMFAKGIVEAYQGENEYGARLTATPEGKIPMATRLNRIWKSFKPTFFNDIERVYRAFSNLPTKGGFKILKEQALQKAVGIPFQLVEPYQALPYNLKGLGKKFQQTSQPYKALRTGYEAKDTNEIVKLYEDTLKAQLNSVDKIFALGLNAKAAGMKNTDIILSLRKDGYLKTQAQEKLLLQSLESGKFLTALEPVSVGFETWAKYIKDKYKQDVDTAELNNRLVQIYSRYMGIDLPTFKNIKEYEENKEE